MAKYENLINKDLKISKEEMEINLRGQDEDENYTLPDIIDFGNGLKCNIRLWSNESNIAHFHLISEDNLFHTILCIYEPKYYDHNMTINKLNNNQIQILMSRLNDLVCDWKDITIWECICNTWNIINYDKHYINEEINITNLPITNYFLLNDLDSVK